MRLPLTALIAVATLYAAESVLPDPKSPQYQSKGDQKRTYAFPGTGEAIPYHLYVPSKWTPKAKLPLVVILHGANQGPDTVFERNEGILGKTAEQRGYIVVAPIGYRPNGGYNNAFRIVPAAAQDIEAADRCGRRGHRVVESKRAVSGGSRVFDGGGDWRVAPSSHHRP